MLVVWENAKRLADLSRDVVGVPLRQERHGDMRPRWGCTLGEIHFAIHPVESFPDSRSGVDPSSPSSSP